MMAVIWCGAAVAVATTINMPPLPKYELKLEACVTYLLSCIEWVGMDGTRMESKPVRNTWFCYIRRFCTHFYGCSE